MKILMVAIPNHHFFRWVNQLEQSGFEVFWFDVSSNGNNSHQISWVKQNTTWKLKWNFPLRATIKQKLPKLYKAIQYLNEVNTNTAFNLFLNEINPDMIHCFEMKLAGLPILDTLLQHKKIPLIYSSWGSDLYYSEKLGMPKVEVSKFLKRTDYLITDCKRDYSLALNKGYSNTYLGVFPGNGGLEIQKELIKGIEKRYIIIIKGYEDGVGKAINILKALELIINEVFKLQIIIYSADTIVADFIRNSKTLSKLEITIHSRYHFLDNKKLLSLMGQSVIHIANSISDGMPNALLEAMSMGAFPIQSNPGKVTEEVITNRQNGFLIENPLDTKHISELIKTAILDVSLRRAAQDYNTNFMAKNYNRGTLQAEIVNLYKTVLN